jgi:hypothetical protein
MEAAHQMQGRNVSMRIKPFAAAAACAAAVALVGVGTASAGEITGSGKWIAGSESAPLHGKSICSYSGLNDNYVLGNPLPDADGFTHNQNWGHLDQATRAFLTSVGSNPGVACNPTKSSGEG